MTKKRVSRKKIDGIRKIRKPMNRPPAIADIAAKSPKFEESIAGHLSGAHLNPASGVS